MELFTPTDCVMGPRPITLDVHIRIVTAENAIWFCTPASPILHPLLISNSQVLVFQVSSTNICALSRGGSTETMLLVSQTPHRFEVQSEKVQTRALLSMWAITSHQVIKPRIILAEGAGAMAYVLPEGEDTPVFLPCHKLACHAL